MGKRLTEAERIARLKKRSEASIARLKFRIEAKKKKQASEREAKRFAKEQRSKKVDGLSLGDIEKLKKAIRKVWNWSQPRKLCLARAMHTDGFPRCENPKCKQKKVAVVFADHIHAVGKWDERYIERMFCPSTGLQALCNTCHKGKTKIDNAQTKWENI
jgi:hypothetical protein